MQNKTTLPTLAELYEENIELAFKQDRFNQLVNSDPKQEWVKVNKYANNSKYIPIGIVETLLQKIFKQYRVEVIREGVMFNSVYVTIRLHYLSLLTNEWSYHDGVGAVQLQTKQGSSPAELQNINNNAVMMALPMAKSYAIKDAAEHVGKLFGRDLNRKDVLEYNTDNSIKVAKEERVKERAVRMIEAAKTLSDINILLNELPEEFHKLIKERESKLI
jgi:hypothetical protein